MDDMAAYYPPPPGTHYPYYQPPPPQPQPPPLPLQYLPSQPTTFATYAAPVVFSPSSHGEVRTLFIAGLPEDVKAREIFHLFREFPGYESSHLRDATESNQPFAFAVFRDQPSAIGAMHALNGMVFDLEKGSTLYIDLAKSNSRSKRSRSDGERSGLDKRAKVSAFDRGTTGSAMGTWAAELLRLQVCISLQHLMFQEIIPHVQQFLLPIWVLHVLSRS